MTRPAYDPLRPPAPPFPGYRFTNAGLTEEAITALQEEYDALDYDGQIARAGQIASAPNDELVARYGAGEDAGPSPAMATPETLADQHRAEELKQAAHDAGLPTSGTKLEVATRLVEAGRTGELPVVTPDQVAADAATGQAPDPQSPPPGEAAAAPAEGSPQVAPAEAAAPASATEAASVAAAAAPTSTAAAPAADGTPTADGGPTP